MGRNYRSLGRLAARLEALIPKGILQQQVPKRSYPPAVCCDPWRYRTSAVFSVPESWSPRVPGRRELKPEALIWSPWLLPPQLVPADASGLPALSLQVPAGATAIQISPYKAVLALAGCRWSWRNAKLPVEENWHLLGGAGAPKLASPASGCLAKE